MNEDINIGDIVKFNGHIPYHISKGEKDSIRNTLEIGQLYRVKKLSIVMMVSGMVLFIMIDF